MICHTQEQVTVTVGNLAMEVTGVMLGSTFEQIGVVDGVRMLEECGPDG